MKEWVYHSVVGFGRFVLRLCSRGTVGGREFIPDRGGFFLAANHTGYFDSGLIMGACPRPVRWLSMVEVARGPWSWFLLPMGVIPFKKSGVDLPALRSLVSLVQEGGISGIFPEGEVRQEGAGVTSGGMIDDQLCRLSRMARVPIVPCVCLGAEAFDRVSAWLPWPRTRWAVVFGAPIHPGQDQHQALREAFISLYTEAMKLMGH